MNSAETRRKHVSVTTSFWQLSVHKSPSIVVGISDERLLFANAVDHLLYSLEFIAI